MDRRPLAKVVESLVPWCLRVAPAMKAEIEAVAREEGLEPSRVARSLLSIGLDSYRFYRGRQSRIGLAL